jgi:formiminotetrahydrofolate cyclodeaminase
MTEQTCKQFLEAIGSSAPTPGGGGVSAYAGAMGIALGSMVGNLTLGKKKYADVQADVERLTAEAQELMTKLAAMVQQDAECFTPLVQAYKLPKTMAAAQRDAILEQALVGACSVPLAIMKTSLRALEVHRELASKGNTMAISDVGAGVQFLRAAILGASLNIYINARLMKNRTEADRMIQEVEQIIADGSQLADQIFDQVKASLVRK